MHADEKLARQSIALSSGDGSMGFPKWVYSYSLKPQPNIPPQVSRILTEKSTFPVAIGNVIFLDGQPGQDQLGRIANTAISEEALQAAIGTFSDTLLRVGRPGQRSNIVIEYGPRVIDWIMAGAYLKRAPWHSACWAKDLKMPIFELHCRSAGGWCAEACDGVLLHVRFYGR
jgi:hypothetical protein